MIKYYCLGYKFDLRSRLDFISEYFIVLNKVLSRTIEESAIIAANHHSQKQTLLAQKKRKQEQLLNTHKSSSITARFRKQSQSYAQKLFGTPPSSAVQTQAHLPPPHLPLRSKSVATVPLPAPYMSNEYSMVGRRVAANVKFDLDKTSQGETVIKTTELLDDMFTLIYAIFIRKDREINK